MANEFDLIQRYFRRPSLDKQIIIPNGDDAAVLEIPPDQQIVMTIDTLVLNTHFTDATPVFDLGYKAVTSTISDLAAMGAEPRWLLGSLTLPDNNPAWLSDFSGGLFAAIDEYQLSLIGGDLTRGPLTIVMQASGLVPEGRAVKRCGAQVGDRIYVTNTLGAAAYGLQQVSGNAALNRPTAQIAASRVMRKFAHACIDVSDGLVQDLQHILTASQLGARIYLAQIPVAAELADLAKDAAYRYALAGGEDYQLIMMIPEYHVAAFETQMPVPVTCIGETVAQCDLQILNAQGQLFSLAKQGFQHF